jgi:hypothetical protein
VAEGHVLGRERPQLPLFGRARPGVGQGFLRYQHGFAQDQYSPFLTFSRLLKHSVEVFVPQLPKLWNGDHEAVRQRQNWEEVEGRYSHDASVLRALLRQKAIATMVVFHAVCHDLDSGVPGL